MIPFTDSAYVLSWPRELFRAELAAVLESSHWADQAPVLLAEAFVGDEPLEEMQSARVDGGVWGMRPKSPQREFLERLLTDVERLPLRHQPRPYWPERQGRALTVAETQGQPGSEEQPAGEAAREDWADLAGRFVREGYLDQAAPKTCVDTDRYEEAPDQLVLIDRELAGLLGRFGLWPPTPRCWDDDTFYALIEALGDLVARPRERTWHSWNNCGWHYSRFAIAPGKALYRAEVNALLARRGLPLRLADHGEDAGRLIRSAGDERDDLVKRVLGNPSEQNTDDLQHAIALYRARGATVPERRSAVVNLAGVLERRKKLLKDELLSGDESALFQIANQFDLRHRRADQRTDYDPIFLDWLFWWYLATVELTDRLTERRKAAT